MESELWFSFDGHGSTRVLLDVAGAIAQVFAYDAYGQAIGFDPAAALTEFLYSGEQFDAKIGQQYLRARYYDPSTGTFNRLDPFFGNLTDPQSLHNYLYCHADPVSFVDPSGEFIGPVLARVAKLVMTVACVPAVQIMAGALATHALGYGAVQLAGGNTDVEFIPDAALLGLTTTVKEFGTLIGYVTQLLGSLPALGMLGGYLNELGGFVKDFGVGVAGIDLVFNIASAQLSIVGYVGAGVGAEYFTGNAIKSSVSVYTGLIWNLYNNSRYTGLGLYAELGTKGNYGLTCFQSIPNNAADKPYRGVTIERTLLGGNKAFTITGGYIHAFEPLTINYDSSFHSIALAAAWASASATLFPGGANLTVMGTAGLIASYWPYLKWSPNEALAARQADVQ